MFFKSNQYLSFQLYKSIAGFGLFSIMTFIANAQYKPVFKDSSSFLKSYLGQNKTIPALVANPAVKTRYRTMPTNQLMRWPNYPSTGLEMEQRNNKIIEDRKFKNAIVNDVIKAILTKKTKTAVIPKF
jgi:hypothetical protein